MSEPSGPSRKEGRKPRGGIPEEKVSTPQELLSKVQDISSTFNLMWFRGHVEAGWDLVPNVFREFQGRAHDESFLAQTFRIRAQSRYPKCPDIRDFPTWLFLMQHHGLPTRLLDWTASPLIAAFFAVQERRPKGHDEGGEVFVLDPTILNFYEMRDSRVKRMIDEAILESNPDVFKSIAKEMDWIDPWNESNRHLFAAPFEGPAFGAGEVAANNLDGEILAVKPHEFDPRVVVQASRFTLHGRPEPLQDLPVAPMMLYKFRIPVADRQKFRNLLKKVNISQSTLFHDLDNLSQELKQVGRAFD